MSDDPRAQYAHRLAALADDAPVRAALARIGERRRWWDPTTPWARTYGRFMPGRSPYATLVFEASVPRQQLVHVEVSAERPVATGETAAYECDETLGWLRVSRIEADPALPGLAPLLAQPGAVHVVRYRPGRRCTLRVTHGGVTRYAKVFNDDAGARLYEEGEWLWRAGLAGEFGFTVARPERWDAATRTLWHHEVAGVPVLEELHGPSAAGLVERLGRAAASITRTTLEPSLVFDGSSQVDRSRRYVKELSRTVPRLAPIAVTLLERLAVVHRSLGYRLLRPIHGAPHPSQWLLSGGGLGLVDFDRLSLGDPELDAATFLGELEFEDGLTLPADGLGARFLEAYESVHGPLDHQLLAAYRAHKRLAKALRLARSFTANGDVRAERTLDLALSDLAQRNAPTELSMAEVV
ncbi:MAG: phosphotransferase [Gemmatimonadota bacterium]|nr:phosphotransferase [Gemmatimonadota bacterium]